MARCRWYVVCADAAGRPCGVSGPFTLAEATAAAEVFTADGHVEVLVVNTAGWSSAREGGRA